MALTMETYRFRYLLANGWSLANVASLARYFLKGMWCMRSHTRERPQVVKGEFCRARSYGGLYKVRWDMAFRG